MQLQRALRIVRTVAERRYPVLLALTVVALGTLAVWWHASAYSPFFADDGFISLRYTERFLHGQGLTWNGDDHVEGYSNLLWVLLCAIPGVFRIDLVSGARAVGLICTSATFGALVAAARPRRPIEWLAPALAIAMLAATDAVAVWSMGGLEPPLVGALLAWGIVSSIDAVEFARRRSRIAAALSFGLLCWTRPDGFLWGIGAAVLLPIGYWKRAFRPSLVIVLSVAGFVAAQLLFRVLYYHEYVPNTAYAKVAFGTRRFHDGVQYCLDSLLPLAATWVALALCTVQGAVDRRSRPLSLLLFGLAALWVCYVVSVGGDIFPAYRHLACVAVLAGISLSAILAHDVRSQSVGGAVRWGVTLTVLAAMGTHFDPTNWAKQEVWEWDGLPVGRMLGRGFAKEQPLVAVDAAGSIPFYSELPALDLLGLSDRYLAHHRPKNMGENLLGHELGDAKYYLRRAPDIVCFAVPPCSRDAKFSPEIDMVRGREFRDEYVLARFEARRGRHPLVSELWMRKSGRIGVQERADRVLIPAYFFASNAPAFARLALDDTFEAVIAKSTTAAVDRVGVAAGNWRLETLSPVGSATVRVSSRGRTVAEGSSAAPFSISLDSRTLLDIAVTATGTTFSMSGLELRRAE